jgi:uroporphyrinogen III methyltransferase/synthase
MSATPARARPLAGRLVVVTRPRPQADGFAELLEQAGASVMAAPTIAIEPPGSWQPLDRALERLVTYHWVVFTSVNGVAMVRRRLADGGRGAEALSRCRIAAIGPATARALRDWGATADLVPEEYRAEGLASALTPRIGPGDRVLLPRAAQARPVLVRELQAAGASVDEVPAYRARAEKAQADPLQDALRARRVDVVSFTSSSTVRHFVALLDPDELPDLMAGVVVACIGPVTADTAVAAGLTVSIVPDEYTIPALTRAIVLHYEGAAERSGPQRS